MWKKIELFLLILVIVLLGVLNRKLGNYVASENVVVKEQVVILDAGHGGSDPGKVGIGNILEKDINLQIAKKVNALLKKKKITVIMTRKEDSMLNEEDVTSKAADMKARVQMINEKLPDLAVSIHQNSYVEPSVFGAQVFYYTNSSDGERAAKIMQKELFILNKDNTRQAKANDTYYLLKRTQVPTIIVECGFLTNPEEAKKLSDETYQEDVAKAICAGILQYLQTVENV